MNNRRKLVFALGASTLAAQFASFAQQQGAVGTDPSFGDAETALTDTLIGVYFEKHSYRNSIL